MTQWVILAGLCKLFLHQAFIFRTDTVRQLVVALITTILCSDGDIVVLIRQSSLQNCPVAPGYYLTAETLALIYPQKVIRSDKTYFIHATST